MSAAGRLDNAAEGASLDPEEFVRDAVSAMAWPARWRRSPGEALLFKGDDFPSTDVVAALPDAGEGV